MAKLLLALVAVLATAVVGQSTMNSGTCMNMTGNPFRTAMCMNVARCDADMCQCFGQVNVSTAMAGTCLSKVSTTNCSLATSCFSGLVRCLSGVAETARTNSSHPCYMWAVSMHAAMLTVSASTFNGSAVQRQCGARVCHLANTTGSSACDFGTNYSNVCTAANAIPRPPAAAPPANFVAAITATLTISGSDFALLLNDPTKREQLKTAVASSLSALLGVDLSFIFIIRIYEGSLKVEFQVSAAAGVQPSVLRDTLTNAGTNTQWLSAVTSVYRTVSNGTLGFGGVTTQINTDITVTPVPPTVATTTTPAVTTTTPAPGPVASSAAGASTLAVAAFAVAAMLL